MSVSVRTAGVADADAIARVHVASWEAAYRGIMPDELIDARTVDVRREQWSSSLGEPERITLVACDGGEVVGFASAVLLEPRAPFDSYLQTLYLAPDVWSHGIGRTLLRELSARLRSAGARSMALRTLRLNPARAFYERLGAHLAPEGIENDDGVFDDVVYAFDDIGILT